MTMKRILLLFLLFCGGYVHAQELDSARIHYRQGHREVDVLFRDNRAELERFIRTLREEHGADVTRNFAASLFRNIKYFTLRKLYLCRKWMQKRLQKTTTTGITLPNFDFLA